jgi:hypothetical protein
MQVSAWDSSQHALHSVGTAALFLLSFTTFFPSHFIDWTQGQPVAAVLWWQLLRRRCLTLLLKYKTFGNFTRK